jgi:hypothetical protein
MGVTEISSKRGSFNWDAMETQLFQEQEQQDYIRRNTGNEYRLSKHVAYLFEEKLVSTANQLYFFMALLIACTFFFGSALYSFGGLEGASSEDILVQVGGCVRHMSSSSS